MIFKHRIARRSIGDQELRNDAVTRRSTSKQFIQSGSESVSLPFAAAGVETVSVSISFPTAFPTGVTPRVIITPKTILAITYRVTGITNTGFTLEASDNVGTDYTTAQTFEFAWIAIAP